MKEGELAGTAWELARGSVGGLLELAKQALDSFSFPEWVGVGGGGVVEPDKKSKAFPGKHKPTLQGF